MMETLRSMSIELAPAQSFSTRSTSFTRIHLCLLSFFLMVSVVHAGDLTWSFEDDDEGGLPGGWSGDGWGVSGGGLAHGEDDGLQSSVDTPPFKFDESIARIILRNLDLDMDNEDGFSVNLVRLDEDGRETLVFFHSESTVPPNDPLPVREKILGFPTVDLQGTYSLRFRTSDFNAIPMTASFDELTITNAYLASEAQLLGDYNRNGVVDAADYTTWRDAPWGEVAAPGEGADGSGNGLVGAEDFDVWKLNFGNVQASAAGGSLYVGTVPEPSWLSLILIAASAPFLCRRNTSRLSRSA